MDEKIVESIVERAAEAAVRKLQELPRQEVQVAQDQEPAKIEEYGFAIERRWFWARRYKVVGHMEERAQKLASGEIVEIKPRMILQMKDGTRICIPDIESKSFRVYPLPRG